MRPHLVSMLLLLSCGRPAATGTAATTEPRRGAESRPATAAASDEPGVRVEIIQAGQTPRRTLRYRFRADQLGVMSTAFDNDIAYGPRGGKLVHMPSPPMVMDLELTGMAPRGERAAVQFRIARFDVATSPTDLTDEQTRRTVQQSLQPMVGMTGSMEMDNRGRMRQMKWQVPDSVPPGVRTVLDGMSRSGQDMVVPMPEEPVGVGAEWYAVKNTPFMGIQLSYTSRVKLIAMTGDRITLRTSVEIAGGRQPFAFPGLPPGTTAEIISCDGDGTSDIDVDLDWLSPARMSVRTHVDMAMDVTTNGQTQSLVLQSRMSMDAQRR